MLRNGLKHRQYSLDLFYGTPSPGNPAAAERFALNRFTVTRQLRYSKDETQLALDLVTFINGLPVFTFELKNNLTKQTVADAVQQYQRDRNPRELLFQLGRCVAHFALDDQEVRFCTHLTGKDSWFLPFNQGWNDGAGNPPNPNGIKTDYLWKRILTPSGLTNILERYAQVVETETTRPARRSASRSSRATTSSTWCGSCSSTPRNMGRGSATWCSTPQGAARATRSPGSPTSSSGSNAVAPLCSIRSSS